jgi:putative restriction endonuclease
MPLLYHWQADRYRVDLPEIRGTDDLSLRQNSATFGAAQAGEGLWAFTRRRDGTYVLCAHLTVADVLEVGEHARYGRYEVRARPGSVRLFDVEQGADVEPVLRSLGVRVSSPTLGQSFQGPAAVRRITDRADAMLAGFAADLPLLDRAGEPLTDAEILEKFVAIRRYTANGIRAPHKPLLLLLALSALQRGERWVSYRRVEPRLSALLREYGPSTVRVAPEHPFWRLQRDGIWEIPGFERIRVPPHGNVSAATLREADALGGFPDWLYDRLRESDALLNAVAAQLLEMASPTSLYESLLDAVGLLWTVSSRRRRDPQFREEILRIYERQCAVCGYDLRLGSAEFGLDAAHIRWHAYEGPDEPDNGLALCSLHHVALDRGALTLDDDLRIHVSQDAVGAAAHDHLFRFLGTRIRGPQRSAPEPNRRHLEWHRAQVFRGPARA